MAKESPSLWQRLTGLFGGGESPAIAQEVAEPQVAKARPRASIPDERNPDLEAPMIKNPDDEEAWAVFGDWLGTIGDPRGELISLALQDQGKFGTRIAEINTEYRLAWLGADLASIVEKQHERDGMLRIEWRHGFIDRLRVRAPYGWKGTPTPEVLATLLRHPSARFIRHIGLGLLDPGTGEMDQFSAGVEVLKEHGALPSLRSLHIGDFVYPDEMEISWVEVPDVHDLFPLLPNLEELHLQGSGIGEGEIRHDRLRRIKFETGGLDELAAWAAVNSEVPSLEDLEVWFGDEEYGASATIDTIQSIFDTDTPKRFPKLKRLALMNCMFTNDIAAALAEAPILQQCDRLDLSKGTLTDEGAQVFLDRADRFGHLKEINLEESLLLEAEQALIQAYGKVVKIGYQRDFEEDWVYTAVGE